MKKLRLARLWLARLIAPISAPKITEIPFR